MSPALSRYMVRWEICPARKEVDIELVVQRALEKLPGVKLRSISDYGPLFIANDFKSFVRFAGLTHVRRNPYYPQSNGKLERFHGILNDECIRPSCPETVDEAIRKVQRFVQHYNHVRLHSAKRPSIAKLEARVCGSNCFTPFPSNFAKKRKTFAWMPSEFPQDAFHQFANSTFNRFQFPVNQDTV